MPKTRSSARISGRAPAPDPAAPTTSAAAPAAGGSGASSARAGAPASTTSNSRPSGIVAARRASTVVAAAGTGGAAASSDDNNDDDDDGGGGSNPPHPVKADDGSLSPGAPPSGPAPPPVVPSDHFTLLSSELISLVLAHLAAPPTPDDKPDLHSLAMLALTCRRLLPHARVALYRDLRVDTRVQAHAVHRTLHGSEISRSVRSVTANVESMAKTSSQWIGWFLFHSMHSLCGIIGSCRHLLTLTLYQPADSSAWTNSLCQSFVDLKNLHTLIKDLEPSSDGKGGGAGKNEGMDVGWRARKSSSMWAVSQFVKPLSTLKSLHTLRLCGVSSDSSTLPVPPLHSLRLQEVVLIEVNITNNDLMQLLGDARQVKRFTLWRSSLLSKRGLAHVLKKCPSLVELRIGGSWFGAKEEDDRNFPLNDSLPYLPHLKVLHVSGSLISPAALEIPTVQLSHLYVHGSPSWTPAADPASNAHSSTPGAATSSRISLAEYRFWAQRQRARERADTADFHSAGLGAFAANVKGRIREKGEKAEKGADGDVREVTVGGALSDDATADLEGLSEREQELCNARRMLRVAGWATIFYLITTDILGPFNARAFGWSVRILCAGVVLYVVFGIAAGITGLMIRHLFLQLDSVRFPVRTYGDLGGRVFGTPVRHMCSVLQAIHNGQGVAQIAEGGSGPAICFSVAVMIWAVLGMIIGQIRSLQGLGILANSAVWINILIIILSMAFIAHSPPNYASAAAAYGIPEGPVVVQARVDQPLYNQVNGCELLSEMRRPHDFIRSFALAQAVIMLVYLVYGIYVYALQGQFTLNLAYQGVSKYAWQTVGNALALVTGAIAAALYGNIGLKVIYINIVEGLFKGPPLMTRQGRMIWSGLVVLFWTAAFFIGSCIPSVGTLRRLTLVPLAACSGLVASTCIFQFSYTFPPVFLLGFFMSDDAASEDEPFSSAGVSPRRKDTWRSWSRWRRAIFYGGRKRTLLKLVLFVFFLAALATAALGMWASGTALREALKKGAATSLGCTPPV
ncbi:hypothetical protein DMC30DRAFT_349246 [Rhodotorula diobovata]|uniref:Amino acid transporter transmembrane domain-containing protein n=1 Tax=Rhodotorula diobovata TaxID=5288 RepID=A0A5C5G1H9_9BASI|nr:hypothetical protein DMC30DRAFT_349246 [Rhodotorula diobovata]